MVPILAQLLEASVRRNSVLEALVRGWEGTARAFPYVYSNDFPVVYVAVALNRGLSLFKDLKASQDHNDQNASFKRPPTSPYAV